MPRLLLALILVALAATGPAAEPRESGLQRLATGDATRGWEGVGRLDLGAGAFCTGALVADDLVLTAAHCLFDLATGERIPEARMEFRAGWRNGRAEAYRGIRQAVIHPDYAYLGRDRMDRVAVDLALLRLDRPIRSRRIRPFSTAEALPRGAAVGVVSYARDRAEAPALQEMCHVLERAGGVVMLSCAVDFGASGAPIFARGAEGPEIVSVISAKAEAAGRAVALASELRPAFPRLKAALAAAPPADALNRGSAARAGDGTGARFVRP